jgi:PTS system nitrogen regulatory IIA component
MNPIGELLSPDDIVLDVDVSTKAELLKKVARMLAGRHGLSEAQVLESLIGREQLGSTALGHGVAIPHARMAQCNAATGVFLRTRIAVPFDAPDGKPVSMFLGLVVPKQATQRHLQLLATAAGIFSDANLRGKLRTAADAETVTAFLTAWPDSPPSRGAD